MMATRDRTHDPEPVSQLSLWFGLLGGPAAWGAHLAVSYAIVPFACAAGLEILLWAAIPATMLIAVAAILFAWRGWRSSPVQSNDDGDDDALVINRVRFMGLSGLVLSTYFLAVIVAQSVPIIMQDPCEPAGSIRI